MHYVYVMRSLADDGFYIGYTRDLRKRFAQHTKGTAVATARRRPWKLIYYEAYIEQADAIGRERYLKSGVTYGQVNRFLLWVRFSRSKLIEWPVKDWSAGLLFVQCSQDGAWPTSKRLCQPK